MRVNLLFVFLFLTQSCARMPVLVVSRKPAELSMPMKAVEGARSLMVEAYGSCRVLNLAPYIPEVHGKAEATKLGYVLKPTNKDKVLSTHYYHRQIKSHEYCKKVKRNEITPFLYGYGSKINPLSLDEGLIEFPNQSTQEIVLENKCYSGSQSVVPPQANRYNGIHCSSIETRAIDCTGFITASLAYAGLAMYPETSLSFSDYYYDTKIFFDHEFSCFEKVFGSDLRPGDIISTADHVMMVNSVGADPLGCKNQKLNFTVIQSSGAGNIGINIMPGERASGASLKSIAKKACADPKVALENPTKLVVVRHKSHLKECRIQQDVYQYNEDGELVSEERIYGKAKFRDESCRQECQSVIEQ